MQHILLVGPDHLRPNSNVQVDRRKTKSVNLDRDRRRRWIGSYVGGLDGPEQTMIFDISIARYSSSKVKSADIPAVTTIAELQAPQPGNRDHQARRIL